MTKTKRQLRAEAVERLREINAATGMRHIDVIEALVPDAPRASQDIHAALIDLLTDDEPPEGDVVAIMRKAAKGGFPGSVGNIFGNARVLLGIDEIDGSHILEAFADMVERDYVRREYSCENDTREKLEADIYAYCDYDTGELKIVKVWLDRQAAIKERECEELVCAQAERIAEVAAERDAFEDELRAVARLLKAERGNHKVTLNNWEQAKGKLRRQREELDRRARQLDARDEMTADEVAAGKVAYWKGQAEKAREEAEGFREKLSRALGLADEISSLR